MFSLAKMEKDRYKDGPSKVLQYFALRRIHNISKGAVLSTSLWTIIEFITQRDIHRHRLVMGCEMSKRVSGPFGEYKRGKHDMLTTSEQNPDITKFYKYKQVFLSRSCPNYKKVLLYTLKFLRAWHLTFGNYANITWHSGWRNLISFVIVGWYHLTVTTSSKIRNICFNVLRKHHNSRYSSINL